MESAFVFFFSCQELVKDIFALDGNCPLLIKMSLSKTQKSSSAVSAFGHILKARVRVNIFREFAIYFWTCTVYLLYIYVHKIYSY